MNRQRSSHSPAVPHASSRQARPDSVSAKNREDDRLRAVAGTDDLAEEIVMLREAIRLLFDQIVGDQQEKKDFQKGVVDLSMVCARLSGMLQTNHKLQSEKGNGVSIKDQALAEALKELGI